MAQLRKDDLQNLQSPPSAAAEHPLFNGSTTVGMISGENPKFAIPPTMALPGDPAPTRSGHEALGVVLKQMGLKAEPRDGRYGAPERSYVVYSPTREQMYHLGKQFGQESVVFAEGGKPELMYTNGPNAGRHHPHIDHQFFQDEPEDYYTHMPELGGYLRINFDWDQLHPSKLGHEAAIDALNTRNAANKPVTAITHDGEVAKSDDLLTTLKKTLAVMMPGAAGPMKHPLSYPWHNEHTDHHPHVADPGVILVSRASGDTLAKADVMCAICKRYRSTHNSKDNRRVGFEGGEHDFKTHAQVRGEKYEERHRQLLDEMRKQHGLTKAAPPMGAAPTQHPTNDQAAPVGVSTYAKFALPFGSVDKSTPSDLSFYPYQGKAHEVNQLLKDHGYTPYYAGGKYGRPDLANRNYNTKHLMIYDPSPDSGASFGQEEYTDNWRKVHELAHALSYPELNQIYGEGRRIGKLGTHRTLNEALRAVHWEHLAAHKQRELNKQIGIHVPDHVFNKEYNTVMHDAIHRAVTGKFTEPSQEGFRPHEYHVPLEHSLGMVREAAHNLGLTGMHDLMKKSEDSTMADEKTYEPQEWRQTLAKSLKDRLEAYSKELLALRQRELAKSAAPAEGDLKVELLAKGKIPDAVAKSEACPLCGQPDLPGKCQCLGTALSKADDSDHYNYYLVHKETGKIHGGYEYKEDAHDAAKDHPEPSKIKVAHRTKVDPKEKLAFHRGNDAKDKLHGGVAGNSHLKVVKAESCPMCGQPDLPGKCLCLQSLAKNELAPKAAEDDPGMAKGELCKSCGKTAKLCKCMGKGERPEVVPQNSPEEKKFREDNAKATAAGKKGVPAKPGDGVAKKELSTKPKEPVKPADGNGLDPKKLKKGDFGASDNGKVSTLPTPAPAAAPKIPGRKFGMNDLAAGKAKLQAAGVKPISPLGAPKPAAAAAPAPGVGGLKPPPAPTAPGPKLPTVAPKIAPVATTPKPAAAPKPAAPAAPKAPGGIK